MDNLVILKNNEPTITSLLVAEQLNRDHHSVILLIRNYRKDFEEFGTLEFEILKTKGRPSEFCRLNEEQLTFLLMNLKSLKKDGDMVLKFKKQMNKQFHQMRNALLQIEVNRQNKEWIEARMQGKSSRKEVTDAYKRCLEVTIAEKPESTYAKNPNLLYSNFTRMIYKSLFDIEIKLPKIRDAMTARQLSITSVAELTAQRTIHKELDNGKTAKEIYTIVQSEMQKYAEMVGRSTIIDVINNQMQIEK